MAELVVGAFGMEAVAMDPHNGLWLGRPLVTIAICRRTLMVAGIHVSIDLMGVDTVMWCLTDAFLPKNPSAFGAAGQWPCEGVASRVYVNAQHDLNVPMYRHFQKTVGFETVPEVTPEPLIGDLAELWSERSGIEVDSVRDGWFTAARSNSTVMPEGLPQIPLNQVERDFRRWVVDGYNAFSLPGIERAPIDLWREAITEFNPIAVPPTAPGQYFRPDLQKHIGELGVDWGGRTYWSVELNKLKDTFGAERTYEVEINSEDTEFIKLHDPIKRCLITLARRSA